MRPKKPAEVTLRFECRCGALGRLIHIPVSSSSPGEPTHNRPALKNTSFLPLSAVYDHSRAIRLATGGPVALLLNVTQLEESVPGAMYKNRMMLGKGGQRLWTDMEEEIAKGRQRKRRFAFCGGCGTTLEFEEEVLPLPSRDPEDNEMDFSKNKTTWLFVSSISLPNCDIRALNPEDTPGHRPTQLRDVIRPLAHLNISDSSAFHTANLIEDGLPRFRDDARGRDTKVLPTDDSGLVLAGGEPPPKEPEKKEIQYLEGRCGCGGVIFRIQKPPEGWEEHEVYRKWIKPPKDGHGGSSPARFVVGYCFCDSCRRAPGTSPFWNWMFVPRDLINFYKLKASDNGELSLPSSSRDGLEEIQESETTLETYTSSRDPSSNSPLCARRYCGQCGSHLFFESLSGTVNPAGSLWDVASSVVGNDGQGFSGASETGAGVVFNEGWGCWAYKHEEENHTNDEGITVDSYVNGWKEEKNSFEQDGERFDPELLEEFRRGFENWLDERVPLAG